MSRVKVSTTAQQIAKDDRLDVRGKHRVAVVHRITTVLGEVVLAKVITKGARGATVRRFAPEQPVTVYREKSE